MRVRKMSKSTFWCNLNSELHDIAFAVPGVAAYGLNAEDLTLIWIKQNPLVSHDTRGKALKSLLEHVNSLAYLKGHYRGE